MKTRHLNIILILLGLLVFCSCNNNSEQLDQLKRENTALRSRIKRMEKMRSGCRNYTYAAIVVPEKSVLKRGEEYKAYISISVRYNKNPLRVVLCDLKNDQLVPTKDTLINNSQEQSLEYRFKVKQTGTYIWAGMILQKEADGFVRHLPFKCEYKVINQAH